ncbi:MAG: hypothetical protein H6632_09805 [Anaerolineales bacterium]|nr:hypothetical protein [Anaerolineales bacterium]
MAQNISSVQPTDVCLAAPILPGQAEAWRRFVQELQGPQQLEWRAWCKRAGLRQLQVRLQTTPQQTVVLLRAGFRQTEGWPRSIIAGKAPFDRWLREQILALHGVDLAHLETAGRQELMLDIEL